MNQCKKLSKKLFLNRTNASTNFIKPKNSGNWQSVVGLEVHAQIKTATKLFSAAPAAFAAPVNTNVALFDAAIPGTLPILNQKCVEFGVLTALALDCNVNPVSMFDRKHYFYPDLPSGYQITQQRLPLAQNGALNFHVYTPGVHKKPYKSRVRIKQLQLEQDSGKTLHEYDRTLVDLNRAGVPLMEVVFEPDLVDGEEAAALIKELIAILVRIGTCSCKMEEGALRVDANVSVNRPGEPLGTRTEVKNIGSVRGVASAVRYEIERQIRLREEGGTVLNETRGWDADSKCTISMRDKEVVQDYRYMPEPNLPPLHVAMGPLKFGCVNADDLFANLPELPDATRNRLQHENGLSLEQAIVIVNDTKLLELFENARETILDYKILANFIINDLLTLLHKENLETSELNFNVEYFVEILALLVNRTINRNSAKYLLSELIAGNSQKPSEIVKDKDLIQISDEVELRRICAEVLAENEKMVRQYNAGKVKVFKALMGIIASKTAQKADMAKCDSILKILLNKKT